MTLVLPKSSEFELFLASSLFDFKNFNSGSHSCIPYSRHVALDHIDIDMIMRVDIYFDFKNTNRIIDILVF